MQKLRKPLGPRVYPKLLMWCPFSMLCCCTHICTCARVCAWCYSCTWTWTCARAQGTPMHTCQAVKHSHVHVHGLISCLLGVNACTYPKLVARLCVQSWVCVCLLVVCSACCSCFWVGLGSQAGRIQTCPYRTTNVNTGWLVGRPLSCCDACFPLTTSVECSQRN
jgi:hypothetical protein